MGIEANEYLDFSDSEWLVDEFDPEKNDTKDLMLHIYGGLIGKHLSLRNPVKGIQGLLALLILANASQLGALGAILRWIIIVGVANIGVLAYIAFQLS